MGNASSDELCVAGTDSNTVQGKAYVFQTVPEQTITPPGTVSYSDVSFNEVFASQSDIGLRIKSV